MKTFIILLLTAFCFTMTGCAALAAGLPAVASALSDAGAVLAIIERALDSWFSVSPPDAETRLKANQLLADAWSALRIANSTTRGAQHLSEEERAKAFEEFQEAYAELHAFMKDHGVLKASGLSVGDGTTVEIPEPYAMSF